MTLTNVPPSTEDHIEEHMPWEHLTIPPQRDRRVLIYAAAAGLIAAVLGVVVVRQLKSPAPPDLQPAAVAIQETAPPPPVPAAARPAPAAAPVNADAAGAADTVTAPDPIPYPAAAPLTEPAPMPAELSEADLTAVDTENVHRKAAGTAEWLVLEFFTLDPSEPWRGRVEAASGLSLPADLEPDTSDNPAVSYVEWTRTRSVEQTGEDIFRASVLIRRLVASDGKTYQRLPAEQVNVDLRLEPDGTMRAVTLPELAPQTPRSLTPMETAPVGRTIDAAGIGWPSTRS